jgi:hypothetical protein
VWVHGNHRFAKGIGTLVRCVQQMPQLFSTLLDDGICNLDVESLRVEGRVIRFLIIVLILAAIVVAGSLFVERIDIKVSSTQAGVLITIKESDGAK